MCYIGSTRIDKKSTLGLEEFQQFIKYVAN